MRVSAALLAAVLLVALCAGEASGAQWAVPGDLPGESSWEMVVRVATLRDYNTRVVVAGTALLGLAAGVVGTFLLLRKRALMGDALSHATMPGICLAFIIMATAGGSGKSLSGLLAGALVSGVLGMAAILGIRKFTRLKEDAALGIVLSVFFGLGIAALGMIQRMTKGNAAGLESFIYGKTASMLAGEAAAILATAIAVLAICAVLYKELKLLCFDQEFAAGQGWPVGKLDVLLVALAIGVTVIGLQAVGLILVIALLITPPAAARFWTDRLWVMAALSGLFGAASGLVGSAASSLAPHLPAGAIIVAVASAIFAASLVLGSARGALWRLLDSFRLARKIARQNLLRALYELSEVRGGADPEGAAAPFDLILARRSWSARELRRLLRSARSRGLVEESAGGYRLTGSGREEARRVVRNHRLWEIYLIAHADIAPGQVDRGADFLEHVIGKEMVDRLEKILAEGAAPVPGVPPSPHELVGLPQGKEG